MCKFIFTGPESSGKTTLCKILNEKYNIPYNKEYARVYLKRINRDYTKRDLLEIAINQLKTEIYHQSRTKDTITILDTDLITIKIWSEYKYKQCDRWILEKIDNQKQENRFYFLCKPDIPWEKCILRENPDNRMLLFNLYIKELERLDYKYLIIEGEKRIDQCLQKMSSINKKLFL